MSARAWGRPGVFCAIGVAAAVLVSPALGQAEGAAPAAPASEPIPAESLPSAEELFEAYVEAIGGDAVIRATQTRRFVGRVSVYARGQEAPIQQGRIEIWGSAPWTAVQDTIFPGQGSLRTIVDGGKVWQLDESDTVREITGPTAARQLVSARFYQLAEWRDMFSSIEVVDGVARGDQRAARVAATHVDGRNELYIFDLDSGLLLAVTGERPSPTGGEGLVPFQRSYEDYTEAEDGVLYPNRVVEAAGPVAFEILVSEIETGVDVPEFDVPDFSVAPADAEIDAEDGDGGE
ncbi:MAG: hypothetical protein AAFR96_10910 [Planctomycetota bacterium]